MSTRLQTILLQKLEFDKNGISIINCCDMFSNSIATTTTIIGIPYQQINSKQKPSVKWSNCNMIDYNHSNRL